MSQITWNTEVNAPCCPGEIVNEDGRTVLIQTDTDFPGVASSFGWSMRTVQPDGPRTHDCRHSGTDGTVNCPECGVTATEFISAAREYLANCDGATADDPGYFE